MATSKVINYDIFIRWEQLMQKLRYLEGLRGLAALVVVVHHYSVGFYPAVFNGITDQVHTSRALEIIISRSPLNIFFSGNLAVCIFFVLSGYVLTHKYFKSHDKEILLSGAIRRYFRLVIPIIFSIFLAYVIMTSALFYNQQAARVTRSDWWLAGLWAFQPDFLLMLKQASFEVFIDPSSYSYNIVLWTMSYEFYGSFLVFGLALLMGRFRYRYFLYTVIALILLNNYYLALFLGLVLSDTHNGEIKLPERVKGKFINASVLIAGLILGSYPIGVDTRNTIYEYMRLPYLSDPAEFFHIMAAFLLLLAILNSDFLQAFFSNRFFDFLGRISFSMYLLHVIILCSLSSYLFVRLIGFVGYGIAFLITFTISMMVLFSASYLMYKFVDLKAIRFSHQIYQGIINKSRYGGCA